MRKSGICSSHAPSESVAPLLFHGAFPLSVDEGAPVSGAEDVGEWFGVQCVQRRQCLADLGHQSFPVGLRYPRPGMCQVLAAEPRHQDVAPTVLVGAGLPDVWCRHRQPSLHVGEHPSFGNAVPGRSGREQLQDVLVTDRVDRLGTVLETDQGRSAQTQTAAEVLRTRPHDRFVGDDRVPLLVRFHQRQHAREGRRRGLPSQPDYPAVEPGTRTGGRSGVCAGGKR